MRLTQAHVRTVNSYHPYVHTHTIHSHPPVINLASCHPDAPHPHSCPHTHTLPVILPASCHLDYPHVPTHSHASIQSSCYSNSSSHVGAQAPDEIVSLAGRSSFTHQHAQIFHPATHRYCTYIHKHYIHIHTETGTLVHCTQCCSKLHIHSPIHSTLHSPCEHPYGSTDQAKKPHCK